jgi:hypothetical protein
MAIEIKCINCDEHCPGYFYNCDQIEWTYDSAGNVDISYTCDGYDNYEQANSSELGARVRDIIAKIQESMYKREHNHKMIINMYPIDQHN